MVQHLTNLLAKDFVGLALYLGLTSLAAAGTLNSARTANVVALVISNLLVVRVVHTDILAPNSILSICRLYEIGRQIQSISSQDNKGRYFLRIKYSPAYFCL